MDQNENEVKKQLPQFTPISMECPGCIDGKMSNTHRRPGILKCDSCGYEIETGKGKR